MAKSGLDTELRHSAERTSESILGTARADDKRLGAESERVVEDRRREVLKDKEAEYGAEARIAIAAERHAAMRAVLLARTHLVDRVLERAQALLPDVARNEAYLATLGSELTDALQFVRTPDDEVGQRLVTEVDAVILTGAGETAEVQGSPQSFPHALLLGGPEEGAWEIEGIEATYHCQAEEPYTVRLGAVTLDHRSDLNIWHPRPGEVLDV